MAPPLLVANNFDGVVQTGISGSESGNKASSSVYDSELRGAMTAVKTDWTATYTHPTPALYVKHLNPLDYGFYQDSFNDIIGSVLGKFCGDDDNKQYRAVEFGALYGNSTLAYKFGLDWEGVCDVWATKKNDDKPLVPKRNIHVVASDISTPALKYGLRRGIYDEVVEFDFNSKVLPIKLHNDIYDGDMLFILMSTNYLKTESFQRLLTTFLGDRSKPKLLCYNVVCAFDARNLSPLAIIPPGVDKYSVRTDFTKHRNFSPEEAAARRGCTESWTVVYTIVFDANKDGDDMPKH